MLVAAVTLGVVAVKGVEDVIISEIALGMDAMIPVKDAGVVPNPLTVILSPIARLCEPVNVIVTDVPDTDPLEMRGFLLAVEYV
jgi:hypothetical protein